MSSLSQYFNSTKALSMIKEHGSFDFIDTMTDPEKYGCVALYTVAPDIAESIIFNPSIKAHDLYRLSTSTASPVRHYTAKFCTLEHIKVVHSLLQTNDSPEEIREKIFNVLRDDEHENVISSLINNSCNIEELRYIASRSNLNSEILEKVKSSLTELIEVSDTKALATNVSKAFDE